MSLPQTSITAANSSLALTAEATARREPYKTEELTFRSQLSLQVLILDRKYIKKTIFFMLLLFFFF